MAQLPGDSVVVITGASSGIGRAAARLFARQGLRLVLTSRNQDALDAVVEECRTAGGSALAVAADVADEPAVERLRQEAVSTFGRIDVWVNCAAVLLFGRFEDVPAGTFRQVLNNNVMGYVHGGQAALRQFRQQDDRGVLINVSSMLSVASEPHLSAYVASKFAIRGLSASIRQELTDFPAIRVCTILPAAIDTPMYQKAANHFGKEARSIVPVYQVERAARAIVKASKHPKREIRVGGFATAIDLGCRVAPGLVERSISRLGPRLQFSDIPRERSDGNLYESTLPEAADGGWRQYWMRKLRTGRSA
jgi:NAD(P)-dependent dehydrogenase (short-subunit alcohol dehydrogenase family)